MRGLGDGIEAEPIGQPHKRQCLQKPPRNILSLLRLSAHHQTKLKAIRHDSHLHRDPSELSNRRHQRRRRSGHTATPAAAAQGAIIRYTRAAVPLYNAVFSAADAPAVMRLNAFHSSV